MIMNIFMKNHICTHTYTCTCTPAPTYTHVLNKKIIFKKTLGCRPTLHYVLLIMRRGSGRGRGERGGGSGQGSTSSPVMRRRVVRMRRGKEARLCSARRGVVMSRRAAAPKDWDVGRDERERKMGRCGCRRRGRPGSMSVGGGRLARVRAERPAGMRAGRVGLARARAWVEWPPGTSVGGEVAWDEHGWRRASAGAGGEASQDERG
jgi:hypothetical protein